MKRFITQRLNEEFGTQTKLFYHGSPHSFDKFDINKIGTGDGLSKFGHGLYFTDDIDTALYYANELSIGDLRSNGFNLYTVKLFALDTFYEWEAETPSFVAECVISRLTKMGHDEQAAQIEQEYEEYGNYWEMRNMYEVLKHVLGSGKATSEFLNRCGVGGVIGKSPAHNGNVYTAYDDNLIKIVDIEKVK